MCHILFQYKYHIQTPKYNGITLLPNLNYEKGFLIYLNY